MLDFMWQLMRDVVSAIPASLEDYFLEFKDQFNAGNTDDEIQEQSHGHWYNPATWGTRSTSPNLVRWLNSHKGEVWPMLYGSLPHP
jgi:hypothetical protein